MRQKHNTWFCTGGSGLYQTHELKKNCGLSLDWAQFLRIRIILGLKNFRVLSSLVARPPEMAMDPQCRSWLQQISAFFIPTEIQNFVKKWTRTGVTFQFLQ